MLGGPFEQRHDWAEYFVQQREPWRRPQGNGSPLSTYNYTAKFDGKPYPIPNWGKANVTLKRVDPNTIERTIDGAEIGKETARWTLSTDRKILTVVANGTDATGVAYTSTQVYERRQVD